MKRIRLCPAPRYPDDCKRIVDVAAEHGFLLSVGDAEAIWQAYSNSMAAGWMILPVDDQRIMHVIESHSVVDGIED